MIIPLDKANQTLGSISINCTESLNKSVKTRMEAKQETIILHALLFPVPEALPEKITGKIGRTQGAKTLSIPAKNETIIRIIESSVI